MVISCSWYGFQQLFHGHEKALNFHVWRLKISGFFNGLFYCLFHGMKFFMAQEKVMKGTKTHGHDFFNGITMAFSLFATRNGTSHANAMNFVQKQ